MITEYFIYKLLATALMVSIYLFWRRKSTTNEDLPFDEPKETTDGKFAVKKDVNDDITKIDYEEIRSNPEFKDGDKEVDRLPDPKGTPTIRP